MKPLTAKRTVETDAQLKAWYDAFFAAEGTWVSGPEYADRIRQTMSRYSGRPLNYATVLDVACGGGHFLSHLQQNVTHAIGCDLSRSALDEARARVTAGFLAEANGQRLPFRDQIFDFVTCLGSLEHFLDIPTGLSEMRRVLKPVGRMVILVPVSDFWLEGDIQPTEVVLPVEGWIDLFRTCGLKTIVHRLTEEDAVLQPVSPGCAYFILCWD